jgi:hypothetical protein
MTMPFEFPPVASPMVKPVTVNVTAAPEANRFCGSYCEETNLMTIWVLLGVATLPVIVAEPPGWCKSQGFDETSLNCTPGDPVLAKKPSG